jgi:pimeloyl-ACP methyl ester carboxylesterase
MQDDTFNASDIYVYEYPTSVRRSSFSIDEIAENMRLFFDADGVSKYKEIIFLAHSMGGLARKIHQV